MTSFVGRRRKITTLRKSSQHQCKNISIMVPISFSSLITCSICCFALVNCLLDLSLMTANASMLFPEGEGVLWDHSIDLSEDFRILWKIINQDITFEIQARTRGYVGLGFSEDGNLAGADMAIGWVDRGQTYFQDRHIRRNGELDPVVDPSQDYILIMGYENSTHTVLRFRRKLNTCDLQHDIAITNDTVRVLYMYNNRDPRSGPAGREKLPDPLLSIRPYKPLVLTQRPSNQLRKVEHVRILELRNEDVELPDVNDTIIWCKMFKFEDLKHKHHIVKYGPVFDMPASVHYLQRINLHECHGMHQELEEMARELGRPCMGSRDIPLSCDAIVASWSRGSKSFRFPDEAGYPIETRKAKYYLMETHYNNFQNTEIPTRQMTDNSGLKIYFTHILRHNDAGVLSIGMDPNWRHIIPPGQNRVRSEGQCIEDCTAYAFPAGGIKLFAVLIRTHLIGKEVKLRQIRQNEELLPIVHDSRVDVAYQEFRQLTAPVLIMPGDRLIVECIYDSLSRKAITLGGLTLKEETCIVLTLYYPRQTKLSTCHSLPSLPTVLHSLGIEQLATDSNPVLISSPPELAGMTLEERLLSYDWRNHFNEFQDATSKGSFKPLCWGIRNHVVPSTEYLEGQSVNITKTYKKVKQCKQKRLFATAATTPDTTINFPVLREADNNNIIEGAAQSSRSSATERPFASRAFTRSATAALMSLVTFILHKQFTLMRQKNWCLWA